MTNKMTTKLNKPDFQSQLMDAEPIKAKGWRNLYMRRSGGSVLGAALFPNIIDAKKASEGWLNDCLVCMAKRSANAFKTPDNEIYYKSDFPMTVLQIPVAE